MIKNPRLLQVEVQEKTVTYTLVEGPSLRFIHSETTRVSLKAHKAVTLQLKDKFTDIATLEFDGIIFDMDLLMPNVDAYHMAAWVATLNEFLLLRGTQDNTTYAPVTEVGSLLHAREVTWFRCCARDTRATSPHLTSSDPSPCMVG